MPQLPVEVLSVEEVERLIARPDHQDVYGLRDVAILATLYYAAATAGEIAHLDLRDVDLEEGEVRFRTDEGRRRRVFLDDSLRQILGNYLAESRRLLIAHGGATADQGIPAIFVTNRGHRVQVRDIRQILSAHAKAAGLKTAVNLNTLRLSRAWHLREAGESPEAIQRLLGTPSRSGRRVV